MCSSSKYATVYVLISLLAVKSTALKLLADTSLHNCPCRFRVSGYSSGEAFVSVQILPQSTYTSWKKSGRPDDIVRSTSSLRQGKFSAKSFERRSGSFALLVHGSPEVSAKVEVLESKKFCPLRLNFPSRKLSNSVVLGSVSRILNGADITTSGSLGYDVVIGHKNGFCSGSLVAPQWVLSAAHCGIAKGNVVWVENNRHLVEAYIPHPQFKTNGIFVMHDLALIKLTEPVRDAHMRVIAVHGAPEQVISGRYARATGYGINKPGRKIDMHLRAADLKILTIDQCRSRLRARGFSSIPAQLDPTFQICADGNGCGTGTCVGDSGGPLSVVGNDGKPVQVGVLSFSVARCSAVPDVYSKVALDAEWIQKTTGGDVRPVRV